MGQVLSRVMLGLVALLATGYAGFQIWRAVYADYETMPATEYIISQKITAKGVAIREESVLTGYGGENLSYLYTDGTHVSKNMSVARVVSSKTDITNQMKLDALQRELDMLLDIPTEGDGLVLQTDAAPQRVYGDIDKIISSAALGILEPAQELRFDILSQLNRRNIATRRETDFSQRIEVLKTQIRALGGVVEGEELPPPVSGEADDPAAEPNSSDTASGETAAQDTASLMPSSSASAVAGPMAGRVTPAASSSSDTAVDEKEPDAQDEKKNGEEAEGVNQEVDVALGNDGAIAAPHAGYFTKTVDGFESQLTIESMESLSVEEYVKLINAPVQNDNTAVGKIITSHVWYFAAVIPSAQADKFVEGRKVELDFGLTDQNPFIASIYQVVSEPNGARTVVVFQCQEMSEELSNMRSHKVDISLSEMAGYKFPRSSKYYLNNQLGVYVLETTVIKFKPAEILYESEKDDYVVYSMNFSMDFGGERGAGIDRFDEVIIGGTGLYNGKVIKKK